MSSIGTGYDLSASQFSPDGRVFQVEYAGKAVENSGTVIGLRGKDGVVFAVEKLAVAGLISDARQICETARSEASNYRSQYRTPVPLKYLNERVSMYMHAYTLYSAVRPYGCSVVLGSWTEHEGPQIAVRPYGCSVVVGSWTEHEGPQMFMLEPSGVSFLSWVSKDTKGRHQMVPRETAQEAETLARQALADVEDSDEGDM
ncbi:Proteasome subunit alpha type [Operophtera brumata]|uniref:Proteasome subunit alpha type n=1 Tax=Operophtera brumata TaxID=104452 RepID=A0A0L7KSW2_OPEBR|nr:Proteasome subunit alpha type [Operophtera brumata]